jgi:hypothetical protein
MASAHGRGEYIGGAKDDPGLKIFKVGAAVHNVPRHGESVAAPQPNRA